MAAFPCCHSLVESFTLASIDKSVKCCATTPNSDDKGSCTCPVPEHECNTMKSGGASLVAAWLKNKM